MEKIELQAKVRTDAPNRIRTSGGVPAVVYGKGFEPVSLEVDAKKLSVLFSAGSNKNVLINLKIDGGKKTMDFPVLAHDIQVNSMNDKITHVDFLKINMEEEIKTKVSISVIGESSGVKLDGGILVQAMRQLEVKCLPGDIPGKIEVDVSALKIGDSIHVGDIKPPKGVSIVTPKDEVVVTVTMPTKEEEVAPAAAAAVEGAPVEGAPAEGAVPAEGAAPADAAKQEKGKEKAGEGDAKAKAPQKPAK